MSLSVEQVNDYQDKWWILIEPILSGLLTSPDDGYLNRQVSSFFWVAMSKSKLDVLLEELLDGYDIFVQDEWSVELPKLIMENDDYVGDIVIDLSGARTSISLKHFCFVAKCAALFYAKHIDDNFKPWAYFFRLEKLCEEFDEINAS